MYTWLLGTAEYAEKTLNSIQLRQKGRAFTDQYAIPN